MIARVWIARATRQGAVDYTTFFKAYWLPKLPSYSGYRGVTAQTREVNDVIEITLTTFWDSLEAALAFGSAGKKDGAKEDRDEAAIVPEEAVRCLLNYDPSVVHHEVVVDCFPIVAKLSG